MQIFAWALHIFNFCGDKIDDDALLHAERYAGRERLIGEKIQSTFCVISSAPGGHRIASFNLEKSTITYLMKFFLQF